MPGKTLALSVMLVLNLSVGCSGTTSQDSGDDTSSTPFDELHSYDIFGKSETAGMTVLHRQLVRASDGSIHALVLVGGGAQRRSDCRCGVQSSGRR